MASDGIEMVPYQNNEVTFYGTDMTIPKNCLDSMKKVGEMNNPTLNDVDYAFAANECLGEWITEASRRVYTDEEKIGKIPIQQYLSEKATDSLRYKEATQATREFMDGTQASHAYEQYMYHSMLCEYIRIEMGDKESMDLDEIKEVEKLRLIHKNGSNIVNKQTTKRIDPICSLTYSPEQLSERDSNELPYLSSL
ncbi:hypothetical protein L204_104494 [Cryptococcus depauperatus]